MFKYFAAAALTLFALPALAQEAPQPGVLPGGAKSLTEEHGDWRLSCTAPQANTVVCNLSQQQIDAQSRQRILTMVIEPKPDGSAKATAILPFGLALGAGVSLQLDENGAVAAAFSTCLPAGCLVPVEWSAATVAGLRQGKVLKIMTSDLSGQQQPFSVSLNGISGALDRAQAVAAGQ
jgi:invasion protein IalB